MAPAGLEGIDIHQTLTRLAEYSAAVAKKPQGMEVRIGGLSKVGPFTYLKDSYMRGPKSLSTSPEGTVIDGWFLDNVIFEDATVVYNGGPVPGVGVEKDGPTAHCNRREFVCMPPLPTAGHCT